MDALRGDDLRLACRVVHAKYKQCVKDSLVRDVVKELDPTAPARKCGALFADLSEYCSEYLRSGELQTGSAVGGGAGAGGAAGARGGR
jgi:hypothetical protein